MAVPLLLGSNIDISVVDKRRSGRAGITDAVSWVDYSDFASPLTLDTQLATTLPTVYTTITLNKMTLNDKIYALRVLQESAGI